jgi:hypothetical protein
MHDLFLFEGLVKIRQLIKGTKNAVASRWFIPAGLILAGIVRHWIVL